MFVTSIQKYVMKKSCANELILTKKFLIEIKDGLPDTTK